MTILKTSFFAAIISVLTGCLSDGGTSSHGLPTNDIQKQVELSQIKVNASDEGSVLTVEGGSVVAKLPAPPVGGGITGTLSDESGHSTNVKIGSLSATATLITTNKEVLRYSFASGKITEASENLIGQSGTDMVSQAICHYESNDCTGQCIIVPNSWGNSSGALIVGLANLVISSPSGLMIITGQEPDHGSVNTRSKFPDGGVCSAINTNHSHSLIPSPYQLPDGLISSEKITLSL